MSTLAERTPFVNLDVALLRTFVAAADGGGVARAAEYVGRSQPAASLQLKRLEELVGSSLFEKNGRGVALTEKGQMFLGYARRLLEMNDESMTLFRPVRLSGSIRLGISQDFAEGWLTEVMHRFTRDFPSILMEVKTGRNATLTKALERREIDLALMFGEKDAGDAVDLGRVPVIWIGSRARTHSGKMTVPLVVFDAPCEFRDMAIAALEKAGMPWRLAFSSASLASQWSAIEAGLGVSIRTPVGLRSSLVALGKADGLPQLPSKNLRLLLRRSDRKPSPAVSKFQEALVETIREKLPSGVRKVTH